jgi:protein-tyrosine-phosphatase
MTDVHRILFVCTGNTCRSAMAVTLWRGAAGHAIEVDSVGTMATPGKPSPQEARQVMAEYGLDQSPHRAKLPTADLVEWADLVLTMSPRHQDAMAEWYPEAAGKTHLLTEYVGQEGAVPDPIGQPEEEYRRSATIIANLLEQLKKRLSNNGAG